jgi:acetyl-CoA C-acetyltransferase
MANESTGFWIGIASLAAVGGMIMWWQSSPPQIVVDAQRKRTPIQIKGRRVAFEMEGGRIHTLPPSYGMIHDPTGKFFPKCHVFFGPYQRTETPVSKTSLETAYYGSNYPGKEARLELPRGPWRIVGNVVQAGVGQAPARQAALFAGLPDTIAAYAVNKVCGSGLKAVMLAAQAIKAGDAEVIVAGGMESMSNAPYYLFQARGGYRMGNGNLVDGMIHDGLWDPYNNVHMGACGDKCAAEYKFSREAQDEYAKESFRRALAAQKEGMFAAEITPVAVPQKKGDPVIVKLDEGPAKGDPSKFGSLRPAFAKDGTITAANASSINDGASALVLASEKAVKEHKLEPLGRIVGYAGVAQAPEWFTTAPAKAIDSVCAKLGIKPGDVDLYEINEAFAVVTMAAMKEHGLPHEKVNVHGGACALGHPIGASGARILVTLIGALRKYGLKRGVASLCIGGGEATAMAVELV